MSACLERPLVQPSTLIVREVFEALDEVGAKLMLTFVDRPGEARSSCERLFLWVTVIHELFDEGELDLGVVETTENVLKLFELFDETLDGRAGIQIGEELEEVAQLLAVDSQSVEQGCGGIDVDPCAAFPDSPVGLEDSKADHLDDWGGRERWLSFPFRTGFQKTAPVFG